MNRELGFSSGVEVEVTFIGEGTGPHWMHAVDCDGNEDKLSDCSFPGWGFANCEDYKDAGVKCELSKYYRGMIPPFEMEQLSSF